MEVLRWKYEEPQLFSPFSYCFNISIKVTHKKGKRIVILNFFEK